jgi:riboflavin kinase/FMN adenylyltransferase
MRFLESDVDTANQLLGYPFFFSGLVVHGDKIGRTIGYPTANLQYTNNDKIHWVMACMQQQR